MIKDDTCLEFVSSKMPTDEETIKEYLETIHYNIFGDSDEYFICVSYEVDYLFIYYAWHDGSHKGRRRLYDAVTEFDLPVYFTTSIANLYPNHSTLMSDNLYLLKL